MATTVPYWRLYTLLFLSDNPTKAIIMAIMQQVRQYYGPPPTNAHTSTIDTISFYVSSSRPHTIFFWERCKRGIGDWYVPYCVCVGSEQSENKKQKTKGETPVALQTHRWTTAAERQLSTPTVVLLNESHPFALARSLLWTLGLLRSAIVTCRNQRLI